jgi:hypothetical protein
MALDKQERLARQKKRLSDIEAKITIGIAHAENELAYQLKVRSAYFLLSMLTLWIKIPKDKATMPAVEKYARRMNNGKRKKEQKTESGTTVSHTHNL